MHHLQVCSNISGHLKKIQDVEYNSGELLKYQEFQDNAQACLGSTPYSNQIKKSVQ